MSRLRWGGPEASSRRVWTGHVYPRDWPPVLLGRFLLRHAVDSASHIAVVSDRTSYTYNDLGRRAEAFTALLSERGMVQGDVVAVHMEPCFEAVALLLACSELGLIYAPLTSDNPPLRTVAAIRAVAATAYISSVGLSVRSIDTRDCSSVQVSGVVTDGQLELNGRRCEPSIEYSPLESDPAYIVFTSGSTGEPKGIVMSHRATVVAFRAIVRGCALRPGDRLASLSPLGFDFSLLDVAAALGAGATIVFVNRLLLSHPARLVEQLCADRITQMHCVPSICSSILRHSSGSLHGIDGLRRVVFAGETLPSGTVRELRSIFPDLEVVNCYGQSESICCTFYRVPIPFPADCDEVSIGASYPGLELFLLDDSGSLIKEQDHAGELYIRGASLFSGYWKSPEASSAALVPNPLPTWPGEVVFRTGDLARYGPDGMLYFVGRVGSQVQVRGNRVELEEVERTLRAFKGVADAAVLASPRDSSSLAACVVAEPGWRLSASSIREHCRSRLPSYMVPRNVTIVPNLPLGPTGKLDRTELPSLLLAQLDASGYSSQRPQV